MAVKSNKRLSISFKPKEEEYLNTFMSMFSNPQGIIKDFIIQTAKKEITPIQEEKVSTNIHNDINVNESW